MKVDEQAIRERIAALEESRAISEQNGDTTRAGIETFEIKQLEWVLEEARIPEEKSWKTDFPIYLNGFALGWLTFGRDFGWAEVTLYLAAGVSFLWYARTKQN